MRITSGGNVGIGTTSPGVSLDVNGSGIRIINSTPNVYFNNTTVQWKAYMPSNNFAINDAVRDVLTLGYNGAASYFSGCNVGIGTTSPSAKLQVSGSTNVVNIIGSGSAASSSIFSVDGNNGRLFEITDDLSDSVFSANTIAGLPVIEAFSDYTVRLGTYGGASGSTVNITGSNVGIGTNVPSAKLQVASGTGTTMLVGRASGNSSIKAGADADGGYLSLDSNGAATIINHYVTDNVWLVTGGGNVGIGTTSPAYKLDVSGNGRFTSTLSVTSQLMQGGGAARSTSGTTIAITKNTAFSSNTDIGDSGRFLSIVNESSTAGAFSNICFRINPDGGSNNAMLDVKFVNNSNVSSNTGTLYWTFLYGSSFSDRLSLTSAGTLTAAGDVVAYGSPSDISLKTNIKPLEGALEKIMKLQGVSFTWKEDTDSNKMVGIKDDIGFIAQEVQEVLPDLVRKNDNGLLSLRDKGITALLVEAIKELKAEIDILKNK
jgi:hypothetical protein